MISRGIIENSYEKHFFFVFVNFLQIIKDPAEIVCVLQKQRKGFRLKTLIFFKDNVLNIRFNHMKPSLTFFLCIKMQN